MKNDNGPSSIRVLISETYDPWFNLATEDWIFNDMDPLTHILFLWRNQNTVVIGRFQNPWTECRVSKMEEDGINLARRQSGGGAVFQDLGNTNFTFLSGKNTFSKERNNFMITEAIKKFGIDSYASGRNDIMIDDIEGPKKISGSAFKEKRDRSFHHGTLLINTDLNKLENYLSPSRKKLTSKGIKSVRSRVTNLNVQNSEISHELLIESIIEQFQKAYGSNCDIEILNNDSLRKIEPLRNYYNRLKDWNWRFGETPKFNHHLNHKFDWGEIDAHIDSHKGLMTKVTIFSDSLHPDLIEEIIEVFPGNEYTEKGIERAISELLINLPFYQVELNEFRTWLISEIA
ncbi:MAG: lipoate--protein ligase [Bacteriovoracaceae bacterium]|jgi:lipoate---protein ligase|nr:lipoate--protein ligase [Bacteriovoracaceae bacterium]